MLPLANLLPESMASATSRRRFLVGAAVAGAGLTIGFGVPGVVRAAGPQGTPDTAVQPFEAYLRIAPDNTVTVLAAHLEMGQGPYTGIATLVAEELDADWSQMRAEGAWGNPKLYGNLAWGGNVQGTGGSTAMASSFMRYRKAGALARSMLVAAAAKEWRVPAEEIKVERGVLSHPSGKRATMGELADAAARIGEEMLAAMQPATEVPLKDPGSFRLIGDPSLPRLDNVAKTTGAPVFTIDVRLPGMLTAVVAHPPRFGGKVKSFDASEARKVKGVVDVVEIPRGVAVVAETTWAAIKGRNALKVEWDESGAERRGSDRLLAEYKALLDRADGVAVARNDGDVEAALGSGKRLEAVFEFPYLAHAALEPMNAVAWKHDGIVEVWGGHQMPDLYQAVAAKIAELPPDKVRLHVMMAGGSFGRRATPDADVIAEACSIAKAIGWKAPVKLQWTREDDMTAGRYRPIYVHKLEAALDDEGRLAAWRQRIVGQSIMKGSPFSAFVKNGVDPTSVEGASNLPYAIPNFRVELVTTDVGVPVLWWRSVGSTHTAYAAEVFVDELAHAAGQDPIVFRLAMLGDDKPRHRAVLEAVRDASGWGSPLPEGRARGVALAESFDSYVAQVAEVSLEGDRLRVHKVTCAVDCGIAINPDVIKAQMQGGIGFGLGAILKGEITLDGGRVVQTNFDGYDVLRMSEMPEVEVHIVRSGEPPTGVGEPGVPPIGPAVANAVMALSGKRMHVLPFSRSDLRSA
ncbi:molybdopterin cofactor-binding domain-containing protein [Benzoatithermus flavus]|uniref:Xanthine dehydrogenase family protein molybdopterin-binding subunit n=1 Tax=Benzoatithermus flavus TaxID=3108223 RepID=A0ABU8XSM7_9PROT